MKGRRVGGEDLCDPLDPMWSRPWEAVADDLLLNTGHENEGMDVEERGRSEDLQLAYLLPWLERS